jgi:CelD/BcsL family acetyltransferase involved in cellulose biosynthesis
MQLQVREEWANTDCSFQSHVYTSLPELKALLPEWKNLYTRSRTTNPFANPIWPVTWLQHFAPASAYVVAIRDPREKFALVGVAPLYWSNVRKAGITIPSLLPAGTFIESARNCSVVELSQVLTLDRADSEKSRSIFEAVAQTVAAEPRWGLVNLRFAPDQAYPGVDGIQSFRSPQYQQHIDPYEFVVLSLHEDLSVWKRQLRPNVKEDLRKGIVRPRKDGITCHITCIREPGEIAQAVDHVVGLHRTRAAQDTGTQHINFVPDDTTSAFLRDVAAHLANERAISVYLSRCARADGNSLVAGRIVLETETSIFLSVGGMDTAYSRYNFPTTLVYEIISDAIRRGKTTANLSSGLDRSKQRWITKPETDIQRARSVYVFRARDPKALLAFTYLKVRDATKRRTLAP